MQNSRTGRLFEFNVMIKLFKFSLSILNQNVPLCFLFFLLLSKYKEKWLELKKIHNRMLIMDLEASKILFFIFLPSVGLQIKKKKNQYWKDLTGK